MIYLIYEKLTGCVVHHVEDDTPPEVMNHHAILVHDEIPNYSIVKVVDGVLVTNIPSQYIDICKRKLCKKIDEERDKKLKAGVTTDHGVIQADLSSRINISVTVNRAALGSSDFSTSWRLADNSFVDLNAQQMIEVGEKVSEFTSSVYDKAFALKDHVRSLTKLEDIESVIVSFE